MSALDWAVLFGTLACFVAYGVWRGRGSRNLDGYLLADRRLRWPTVALSVMATQASAVTFLSTPGQGAADGLRFVQFYFGLPLAMVVLCVTAVPIYHRLKVFTAYEYLEQRFDGKTRTLAAALFLVQRGLSAGITIYAPALVLSVVLGWDVRWTAALLGALAVIYTTTGGNKAVSHAHVLQFLIILAAMGLAFAMIVAALPPGMGLAGAADLAGHLGRLNAVNFTFDPNDRYNVWSGLIGGFFLQLSYFGTDQSQVGRFLTARSARESKLGLLFNGLVKVPMQFFILLLGVLVFVAYRFEPAPVFFNPAEAAKAAAGPHADDWHAAERAWDHSRAELAKALREEHAARKGGDAAAERDAHARGLAADVAANAARVRAVIAISSTDPNANTNDTNYIFLRYVLSHLPVGMVGLVLAAIFAAAMNSSMSELNALASTTVVDVVERLKWASGERALLTWSRFATLFWVVFAVGFAQFAARLGSLVEAVNIMGSLFYGTMLGIFLTALFVKRAGGTAVFTAAILGEAAVIVCWKLTPLSFLWWNLIGCVLTLAIAALLAPVLPKRSGSERMG